MDDNQGKNKMKWASDASQMDITTLDELIFRTPQIENFLASQKIYFIAGNKGMGKTLLLSLKRHLLRSNYGGKETAVKFIPENEPYLDFMRGLMDLGKGNAFLEKGDEVRRLWKVSISISIISHFEIEFLDVEKNKFREFAPELISIWMFNSTKIDPSLTFHELLKTLETSKLNRFLKSVEGILDLKLGLIHSAVFVFIDRIDQALSRLSKECWITVQCGLLEAIWDIVEVNRHIKVYASIRQEAFGNFSNPVIKSNIFNHTTQLEYLKSDMIEILDKLSKVYERVPSFKQFLPVHTVSSAFHQQSEDTFDYINRHTVGRPRDFVIMAQAISNRTYLDEGGFKKLVNRTASQSILTNLYEESRQFLECLHDAEDRKRFYNLLHQNILSKDQLIQISFLFNGLSIEYEGISTDDIVLHPFSELLKIGFLGTLSYIDGNLYQKFKQPSDQFDYSSNEIPDSEFYFIHPIISYYLSSQSNNNHKVFKNILVGHDYPWNSYYYDLIHIQTINFDIDERPLDFMLNSFLDKNFNELPRNRPELRESNEWIKISNYLKERAGSSPKHMSLLFLVDKLIEKDFEH